MRLVKTFCLLGICFAWLGFNTLGYATQRQEPYSVIIRGALVVDGTGAPGIKADVAIQGERIAEVAPRIKAKGAAEVQADGLVIAPGFIDIHTHTDGGIFRNPLSDSKIRQGVTTEVINNCGSGDFPIGPNESERQKRQAAKSRSAAIERNKLGWYNFKEYSDALEKAGVGVNIAALVPHNRLRSSVLGPKAYREATAEETAKMAAVLEQAMQDGAWGMSTGLAYMPGSFASTSELVSLSRVLARYNGIYASHIRNEGKGMRTAIEEALQIGRESGARVHISHIKAVGKTNWGQSQNILDRLTQARNEGVRVSADQYPYIASATTLSSKFKPWVRAGGTDKMLQRFKNPETRKKILAEMTEAIEEMGGADKVVLNRVRGKGNSYLRGKTLADLSKMWRISPAEAAVRVLELGKGKASAVYFTMTEKDVETFLADPAVSIGSDAGGSKAKPGVQAYHHPRGYGTFAKILGEYVRERRVLTLEKAVYKMTGLAASQMGLAERGQIKPGYYADLVLFDPQKVNGPADFLQPNRYAVGIPHVMVNGQWAVKDGQMTGVKAGKVLRKGER